MVKTVLYVVGAVLALMGILGFVTGSVLGIFSASAIGNVINLVVGLAVLYAAAKGGSTGDLLVKIGAVVYAVIAILGFVLSGESIFGIIDTNLSTDILNVVIAVVLIWAGFFASKDSGGAMESGTMNPPPMTPPQNPQV